MEFFRPIQCYSCFVWCDHLRNECPIRENPICSKCSEYGHNYTECSNAYSCPNCQGSHSATARICPEYTIAIEKCLPKIAAQLAHHLDKSPNPINNTNPSDNAIGTDILRAAALDSKNENEFLISLFKACNIFIDSKTSLLTANDYLDEFDNSHPIPDDIITKDTSFDEVVEELNTEILRATKNTEINIPILPSTLPPCSQLGASATNNSLSEDNCQYGLANNDVLTDDIAEQYDHAVSCFLKNPNTGSTSSYIMYCQTTPNHIITFCNDNQEKIVLKPEMLVGIEIFNRKIIKFVTVNYGTYELKLNKNRQTRSTATMELALWLRSTYDLLFMIK